MIEASSFDAVDTCQNTEDVTNEFDPEKDFDLVYAEQDPGAVRHGNFINYYAFHPASVRVENFPTDIWKLDNKDKGRLALLDIGCNTGELTLELHSLLSRSLKSPPEESTTTELKVKTLGIDLDDSLIRRAQEANSSDSNVEFVCTDIMKEESNAILEKFLAQAEVEKFSVVFLMSITMWIHIINGDEALRNFLHHCVKLTNKWLVIEPQPWRCYRSAQRRLVKVGAPGFPHYPNLTLKGPELPSIIDRILTEECGMKRVSQSKPTQWRRTTSVYEKM